MSTVRKFLLAVFAFVAVLLSAEQFRFLFEDGDTYRINSYVNEEVYVNMKFLHTAEISNRIIARVSDVQNSPESSALFTCSFMVSEKSSLGVPFSWSQEYPSVFRRNEFGVYTIEKKYFMPVVRNVPVFPKHDIKVGDTWTGTGHEAHDFRNAFGLDEPFVVPFTVTYKYEGPVTKDGKQFKLITAEYQLMYELPQQLIMRNKQKAATFPVTTLGTSKQNLYWDSETGNLQCYDEEFSIRLILNTGDVYDFVGTAYAAVTEVTKINKKDTAEELKKQVDDLKLKNVNVRQTDEGVTISIENIQFAPDSAVLLPSELEKLDKIAELLLKYPERDLLITGHTALAGTKEERAQLSVERANAVAQYLIQKGVRESYRVFTQGFGAERPIAPNTTEKNRSKNRRVEITLIDE